VNSPSTPELIYDYYNRLTLDFKNFALHIVKGL
jgi:hypothetical protein